MRVRFQHRVTREIDGEWTDLWLGVTADVGRRTVEIEDVFLEGETGPFEMSQEEESRMCDAAAAQVD